MSRLLDTRRLLNRRTEALRKIAEADPETYASELRAIAREALKPIPQHKQHNRHLPSTVKPDFD